MIWLALLALGPGCAHRADVPATPLAVLMVRLPLPAEVQAVLEAGAADLDVSVRRDALAALVAADPAPAGGAWGQRGRFDPSEYVQRATVEALAQRVAEPESRALLRGLVEDTGADPWARGAAALALTHRTASASTGWGAVPAEEHAADDARLAAAAAAAPGGRGAALLLAAAMTGDAPAKARLADLLAAGNLPLELWFFRALGASGIEALVGPLTQALDRVEPEIQVAVATALLELGAPAGERALAAALAGDEDRAMEALEALAEARTPAADGLLSGQRAALTSPALLRDAATLALYGRGDGELPVVLRLLADGDAETRRLAAQAAGRRLGAEPDMPGADRLRGALRDALPEADPGLQLAIVAALGAAPAAPDRALLTELLGDESIRVRVAAAAALAR